MHSLFRKCSLKDPANTETTRSNCDLFEPKVNHYIDLPFVLESFINFPRLHILPSHSNPYIMCNLNPLYRDGKIIRAELLKLMPLAFVKLGLQIFR
jgi:hypothetical protein